MLFIKLQERWGGVWVGGWRYFDGDNLGGADGTFACKRTLWSFKVWWDSFSLLSKDLVHFGRKLVDHLGEDIWISCSDGFCNSTHHSINAFGSRVSIDLMRHGAFHTCVFMYDHSHIFGKFSYFTHTFFCNLRLGKPKSNMSKVASTLVKPSSSRNCFWAKLPRNTCSKNSCFFTKKVVNSRIRAGYL